MYIVANVTVDRGTQQQKIQQTLNHHSPKKLEFMSDPKVEEEEQEPVWLVQVWASSPRISMCVTGVLMFLFFIISVATIMAQIRAYDRGDAGVK